MVCLLRSFGAVFSLIVLTACGAGEFDFDVPPSEDQVEYSVTIIGAPSSGAEDQIEATADLFLQQDQGAPSPAFLRRRVEDDIPTIRTILQARGFYQSTITSDIFEPDGSGRSDVTLTIDPGPPFTLISHEFSPFNVLSALPDLNAADLGSPVGEIARAPRIVSAEDAAVAVLRSAGFAYARFESRDAVADLDAQTIAVTSVLNVGRAYRFGPVRFEGVNAVEEAYLETYITWLEGDMFDEAALRTFQQALVATQLFNAISVEKPEIAPEGEFLPVIVVAEERRPRTYSLGLRINSDLGPEFEGWIEHRNLFGRNERGRLTIEVSDEEQLVSLGYRAPQFIQPGQDLVAGLEFSNTTRDAYDGEAVTARLGLERELGDRWRIGASGLVEYSDTVDAGVASDALLFGLPTFAEYENVTDRLDPRGGMRLRVDAAPFAGDVNGASVSFVRLDANGAFYTQLGSDGDLILATRARAGVIFADSIADVPSTRRLYSGGGGSIRGFALDSIGPTETDGSPRGGLSTFELGAELRYRFTDTIGGVAFVEAGTVSDDPDPFAFGDIRESAGFGVRYYSPVGPLRADLAFPIDRRDGEDEVQFYLSIGQAF